jgi:hypothetical protein
VLVKLFYTCMCFLCNSRFKSSELMLCAIDISTLNKTYLIWFRSQVHISRELVTLCWCHIVVSMFSVGISVATWLRLIKYCIYNLFYLSKWLLSLHFIIKYFSLLHNYDYYLDIVYRISHYYGLRIWNCVWNETI